MFVHKIAIHKCEEQEKGLENNETYKSGGVITATTQHSSSCKKRMKLWTTTKQSIQQVVGEWDFSCREINIRKSSQGSPIIWWFVVVAKALFLEKMHWYYNILARKPYLLVLFIAVFCTACIIVSLTTNTLPDFTDPTLVSNDKIFSKFIKSQILVDLSDQNRDLSYWSIIKILWWNIHYLKRHNKSPMTLFNISNAEKPQFL